MPRTARTAKTRTLQRLARKAASAGPPGWGGGGWSGGPLFVDAFRSRRAPSPPELVEACKGVVHACTTLNQGGVARTRLGLYVTTGEGQSRPKCAVHPKLRRQTKAMMAASGQVSRTCLYHQKMAAAAEVEEVAEHPLLAMIQHPNDDWDYDSWVRYAVLCLDVLGWFFSWPEPTSSLRGKPVDLLLWPLLAQYVLPVRYPDGSLTAKYTYFGAEYEPSDLIRGRFVSARDPYGLGYGPTQAAFAYVGLSDQYASVQENLLTQGGKISGYFTEADPAVPIGAPDAQKYERELNATATRANAGRLVYVPGNVKLVPTQWPPADLAALEVDDRAMKRIANCMGVPLSLVKQEDMSLASAEAGHRQHAELAVDPRCVLIANALTRWAHSFGRNHGLDGWDRLYFAYDNPVPEDEERKAKIVDMNLKNGRLTINEANEPDGIPRKEWGDEPWLPSTLVQPSTAAEMRERAASLAEQAASGPKPGEGESEDGNEDDPKDGEGKKGLPFLQRKDQADRGAELGGPSDDDDHGGEENTYGLPDGEDIEKLVREWYDRMQAETLEAAERAGDTIPLTLGDLTRHADEMARAVTPKITAYWDAAGKQTYARLGLDPDDWKVTNPHLEAVIRQAAFDFCQSTLRTANDRVDAALAKLHDEFVQGMVQGSTLPQLTKRVEGVFTGLSKGHARNIAITESSRAVHAAQAAADEQSGVVAGLKLLLSGDACELCREIADRCKQVPLDRPFAIVGDHPTYSTIRYPPLHPGCRCTAVEVLKPEFGGPDDPEWGQTLDQPQRDLPSAPLPAAEKAALKDAEARFGVTFRTDEHRPKDRTVVVDVRNLDAALAANRQEHVGAGGSNGIEGRYEGVAEFLERAKDEGIAVIQPRVYVDSSDRPRIGDGRHRWAYMRDHGAQGLPVSVDPEDVGRIRREYGVK